MITEEEIDGIIAAGQSERDEVVHEVRTNNDTAFTWDYERSRPALSKLYEKAKHSQWNGSTDLPWETEVDQEQIARLMGGATGERFGRAANLENTPVAKWGEKEW